MSGLTTATRRTAVLGALGLGASACSILEAPEPVPLFRFGQSVTGDPANASPETAPVLLFSGVTLPRAAAGDRILTTSGAEVSYIGGSRWASPALLLFDEAAVRAFQGGPVRLVRRGGASQAAGTLRLEVRAFEVRYDAPTAPPTVAVEGRALLTTTEPVAAVRERAFAVLRPASENRVSVIAQAFDAAVAAVMADVLAWTVASLPTRP